MRLIDTDVHVRWADREELARHLEEPWRGRLRAGVAPYPHNGYTNPGGVRQRDATPPNGGSPGSDPAFTAEDLLDRFDIDYAVLLGEAGHLGISNLADPDWATALASAYNDWLVERWLSWDERYLGSIFVAAQDPVRAALEIDRIAENPQFVQVQLGSGSRAPYGTKEFDPIFAAAARHGLPVAIHIGTDGAGTANPPTPVGYPDHYIEWHTCLPASLQAHLVSLICGGAFERHPELRVVLVEGGVAWIPGLLWRLDKNWKALRQEVPWVRRLPSEYVIDHVRFTTQPLEQPDQPEHLHRLFEMMPSDRILMFSSDYPHWDFDDPVQTIRQLPSGIRQRVAFDNAHELYGL